MLPGNSRNCITFTLLSFPGTDQIKNNGKKFYVFGYIYDISIEGEKEGWLNLLINNQ